MCGKMHVPSELGNKMEDIEFAIAKKKRDLDINATRFYLKQRFLFVKKENNILIMKEKENIITKLSIRKLFRKLFYKV